MKNGSKSWNKTLKITCSFQSQISEFDPVEKKYVILIICCWRKFIPREGLVLDLLDLFHEMQGNCIKEQDYFDQYMDCCEKML